MAPVIRRVERHNHVVTEAHGDVLQAARAQVLLARLKRVDERDLDVLARIGIAQPKNAHASSTITTSTAAATIT